MPRHVKFPEILDGGNKKKTGKAAGKINQGRKNTRNQNVTII
jgi:hypothetical protein